MTNIPTWQVKIYGPIYKRALRNPIECVEVEAHTGPAAEEAALANKPGWIVLACDRLSGYGDTP